MMEQRTPDTSRATAEISRSTATRILAGYTCLVFGIYWMGIYSVDLTITRGHVIGSDGLFCYEYLPSLLNGHLFDFCASRQKLMAEGVPYCWEANYLRMLPNGRCATVFAPGWALFLVPFQGDHPEGQSVLCGLGLLLSADCGGAQACIMRRRSGRWSARLMETIAQSPSSAMAVALSIASHEAKPQSTIYLILTRG